MWKIERPGVYHDFPVDDYFGDPAPVPSLSQSIAKVLINQSPLHAWYQHPQLNPDHKPDDDTKFDVGSIAHRLMIGRGKDVVALPFADWRTNKAKEAREEAAANGKLGVLGKHYAKADKMVRAARDQLHIRDLDWMFRDGWGEVVTAWKEDVVDDTGDYTHNPIWLRQMIDWLSPAYLDVIDYKTTDFSVAPHGIDRVMVNASWSIQAAMAERGLDALNPDNAGRRKFFFVVQETEIPYQLTVVQLTRGPMTMGHKQLDRAVEIWRECMATGIWPGYPLDIVQPQWPGWAEQQWLNREIEHDAAIRKSDCQREIPSDILLAG